MQRIPKILLESLPLPPIQHQPLRLQQEPLRLQQETLRLQHQTLRLQLLWVHHRLVCNILRAIPLALL
jgi:hypothetical protein